MTPFTTPIFDFHLVISPLTTPLTTPTPTPSLVKTSLKKALAVDPENWVGLCNVSIVYSIPEVVLAEVLGYCQRAKDHGYLFGPCFPGVMPAE